MTLEETLKANSAAVTDLIKTAERSGKVWTTPSAPGKWSPSQLTEHVARALEESAKVVAGVPSKFPTFPAIFRPLVRRFFFDRVLRKNAFPKAKTTKPFDPANGPATPNEARIRLEAAAGKFTQACSEQSSRGQVVNSTIFGNVTVQDYARFQELHTRHHCKQLPGAD
jgi:hypothetical protein